MHLIDRCTAAYLRGRQEPASNATAFWVLLLNVLYVFAVTKIPVPDPQLLALCHSISILGDLPLSAANSIHS